MEGMEQPLVSCIMPTRNRRHFVEQALRYFEQQDYPNKELIIVDDGDDLVVDLVSQRPNVRYFAPQYIHSVGAKRNFACEVARGEIICHWDDDDWYSASRLSYQVAPFLTRNADITGLHLHSVFDLQHMQGWRCEDAHALTPGVEGMHYGTMLYRKHLWMTRSRFHDSPKGDDGSGFVRRLLNQGARAYTLPCIEHQVYVRHGSNIWKYQPGTTINHERWQPIKPEQCFNSQDLEFYRNIHFQLKQPAIVNAALFRKHIGKSLARRLTPLFFCLKR
ncbi:glycosyltransferase family 2 protein [Dictyobacter arantiisoli]|uniref:Glycosyltransferase 2-like domain-containing protein n=1 Tax=Dictyobacter arantiisoli TaxID=2014874 RepID=A0A5A5TKI4_9CHLR|nr:glycosyltransferase family A protein [Dictyobacter arantiisoli]GCF11414.1 hypothetical protein KDI_49780 [Dictyobacter arantiisoli]